MNTGHDSGNSHKSVHKLLCGMMRIGSEKSEGDGASVGVDCKAQKESEITSDLSFLSKSGNAILLWWYNVDQIAGKYNSSNSISS